MAAFSGQRCCLCRCFLQACSNWPTCPPRCSSDRCWRRSSPAPMARRSACPGRRSRPHRRLSAALSPHPFRLTSFRRSSTIGRCLLGAVAATLAASSFLGWFISRFKVLPGTTAVWGSAPGGATAMVLMAGAFGADAAARRLHAISARDLRLGRRGADRAAIRRRKRGGRPGPCLVSRHRLAGLSQPRSAWRRVGGIVGYLLRLPSPYFLGAVILGAVVHLGYGVPLQLPEWLLAVSYALIGWSHRPEFHQRHPATRRPRVAADRRFRHCPDGILRRNGLACSATNWAVDPLTAYLATSPGGMDSIAIIAAASHRVDISFVMALQSARLLVVLLLGPWLTNWWRACKAVPGPDLIRRPCHPTAAAV